MKYRLKKILCLALVVLSIFGCVACGETVGELDKTAASRTESESEDGLVYIDDEAIALAGSLSESNPELLEAAKKAFELTNQKRADAGLAQLSWDQGLAEAAFVRAQECVNPFSHTRPDGSEWWTVNSQLMYGENLARGFNTADGAMNGWMNSPTHKANIMDGSFHTLGIAIYQDGSGKLHWAQEFGR